MQNSSQEIRECNLKISSNSHFEKCINTKIVKSYYKEKLHHFQAWPMNLLPLPHIFALNVLLFYTLLDDKIICRRKFVFIIAISLLCVTNICKLELCFHYTPLQSVFVGVGYTVFMSVHPSVCP